ncbi:MAG: PorV/PorQ family protein [bacterium]|nr:MAG: PorV/PorQ family protein [bacterium]
MKKYLLTIVLLALFAIPSSSNGQGFNKGGRTAFQFIKIGIGARQTAMGEACISVVRDINSVFWNPANITGILTTEASFSYARWFADMNYLAGAAGYRWAGVGVFALSVSSLDYKHLQEALVLENIESVDPRTGKTFTGGDLMLGLSFAREFTNKLSIGITAKYLREELFVYDVDLLAFDVGTYYNTAFKGFRIAMSAQNFSTGSISWLEKGKSDRIEGYDIPLIFRVGTTFDLIGGQSAFFNFGEDHYLQLSLDAINTNDYGERYHIGGEYWFGDFVALRSGYRFNYAEGNLSFGFGLNLEVSGLKTKVDYAYVNYEFLDSPHRFTVSFSF